MMSYQVSGLVGGQQVMFANHAMHAQQISPGAGYMGGPGGGNYQNPYPAPGGSYGSPAYGTQSLPGVGAIGGSPGGLGALVTGAAGGALPGALAGVSIAGGFMGGAAGWADPFTGVARMFARGAGAGGQGALGTLGHIGKGFVGSGGSLARGAGMLGRGLAAGAAAALPYYAIGEAAQYVGNQMYQGAQNISNVGEIMGRQGPFYGQAGVRPGGGMARSQIKQITSVLHELTGEDVQSSMQSLTKLMSQAQSTGMLSGTMNATDFKQKFSKIVQQVKTVAKVMGSSLEEAMPLYNQMRSMGLWKTSDIMGTATAMQQVGQQAAPHLMGAMQQGAQLSWAQGGSLAAGATAGRRAFMQVQAANQAGVLPEEMIAEMTGGVGGVEGQRMISQKLMRGASAFAHSSMGRLMMAGLGQTTKEGRFTGQIDKDRLEAFQSGNLGVRDLMSMGQKQSSTRAGQVSFHYRAGQIGQEMMSQGGIGAVGKAIDAVMERSGYGGASEDIRGVFIQKMMGVNQRDAEMWKKMINELPRIESERTRKASDAIRDKFQRLEERQNRSWQGFKDSIGQVFEQTVDRPIQEFAERLTTDVNKSFDNITDMVMGRRKRMNIGRAETRRALSKGPDVLREAYQTLQRGGVDMNQTIDLDTPLLERMRMDPTGFLFAGGMEGADPILGRAAWSRRQAFGEVSNTEDASSMQFAARKAVMRAQGAGYQALRGGKLSPEHQESYGRVKAAAQRAIRNPETAKRLRAAKEKHGPNTAAYMKEMARIIKGVDGEAFSALVGDKDGMEKVNAELDLVAGALNDLEYQGELRPDMKQMAKGLGAAMIAGDPAELEKWTEGKETELAEMLSKGQESLGRQVVRGAAGVAAGISAFVFDPTAKAQAAMEIISGKKGLAQGLATMFTGGATGVLKEGILDTLGVGDVSVDDIQEATRDASWNADMLEWISKGRPEILEGNKFLEALDKGDAQAEKMKRLFDNMPAGSLQKMGKDIQTGRLGTVYLRNIAQKRKDVARRELVKFGVGGPAGLKADVRDRYKEILDRYRETDKASMDQSDEAIRSLAADISNDQQAMRALAKQGGVGGQISSMARLHGLGKMIAARGGKGMGLQEFERAFNRRAISGLGVDLQSLLKSQPKEMREELEGMLKDGVTGEEFTKIQKVAESEALKQGVQTGRGAVSQQEKLYGLLTGYAESHRKFVLSVAGAVKGLEEGTTEAMLKAIEDKKVKLASSPGGVKV